MDCQPQTAVRASRVHQGRHYSPQAGQDAKSSGWVRIASPAGLTAQLQRDRGVGQVSMRVEELKLIEGVWRCFPPVRLRAATGKNVKPATESVRLELRSDWNTLCPGVHVSCTDWIVQSGPAAAPKGKPAKRRCPSVAAISNYLFSASSGFIIWLAIMVRQRRRTPCRHFRSRPGNQRRERQMISLSLRTKAQPSAKAGWCHETFRPPMLGEVGSMTLARASCL